MKENNNGPIPKVNTNHHPNYPKCPAPQLNTKQIPYRSENSLHHSSSATTNQQIPHNNPNYHLHPYSNSTAGSSCSTPNLTQMQMSPNPVIPKSSSPQINSRFPFNNGQRPAKTDMGHFMNANYPLQHCNYQRPPLSAPPVAGYKKPISPYHSPMIPNQQQQARMHNGNGYYHSQNQIAPTSPQIYRNGMMDKYSPWQQPLSPNMHSQMPKASKSVRNFTLLLFNLNNFFMNRNLLLHLPSRIAVPLIYSSSNNAMSMRLMEFLCGKMHRHQCKIILRLLLIFHFLQFLNLDRLAADQAKINS